MKDLLFLVHRIPFPPDKGDKIRSWNILEHLASRYRVHVGCFIDDPHDWQFTGRIEEVAASTFFRNLGRRQGMMRSLFSLLTGDPLTCGFYRDRAMASWVSETTKVNSIERVFVYSSSMAQYIPENLAEGGRVVVDFVDIDSDKWRQYSDRKSWPMKQVYAREARTLFEAEKRIAAAADAAAFVSEDEAALFKTMAPDAGANVHGIANGVDCVFFDPECGTKSPYEPGGPKLIFTGAMDYWANVDAVCWFADEIFPRIRNSLPDCEFWIVGANPASEVEKLGVRAGITVTGRVADVRPYIVHATLSVAPLRVARGIQNKVLEAMALEKAVVATPQAMEGIAAIDGEEIFVAEEATRFADTVVSLAATSDRHQAGVRARRRVLESYGWLTSLRKFESILEGGTSGDKMTEVTRD